MFLIFVSTSQIISKKKTNFVSGQYVDEFSDTDTVILETAIALPNDTKTNKVLGPLRRQGSGVWLGVTKQMSITLIHCAECEGRKGSGDEKSSIIFIHYAKCGGRFLPPHLFTPHNVSTFPINSDNYFQSIFNHENGFLLNFYIKKLGVFIAFVLDIYIYSLQIF